MPYCTKCNAYYPEMMPHSCNQPPFYTAPGLTEPDRQTVISIDQKTAEAIDKLTAALAELDINKQAQAWAKNKLLAIEQAIGTLQAAVDLLNEKIP